MHSKMHWDASGESANQSAAWGERKRGGGGFSTVRHCQNQDRNTVRHVQETCPIRCIRDCLSSSNDISCNVNPAHPLQVKSMMQDKGVAQSVTFSLDIMRLLFFDLWFQVLLVCQDVPVPLCDGLVLTHPDLLSHLEKRDKDYNGSIYNWLG